MPPRRAPRTAALAACGLAVALAGGAAALPGSARERRPPGAPAWSEGESAAVEVAWRAASAAGVDTGLRDGSGTPRFANRLLLAASPYLRLHAFQPVDWRPWGDAAFAEAKRLHRPVFLSIGYSTCHWCHVMAAESFEDLEIARLLNERYVAIKVDREELPDVDATYLAALDALGMDGGWPANLWLTPDRDPFFGGTYFAPRDGVRGETTGLLTLLRSLADGYAAHPEQAGASAALVRTMLAARPAGERGLDAGRAVDAAVDSALRRLDAVHGGQDGAPKFPSDLPLRLLLRRAARDAASPARAAVTATLTAMANGALQDQAGGGFHRYTVDDAWQRPHFEKTLYDDAELAVVYLEAFELTGDRAFADTARRTLDALLADFTTGTGGFAAALDADSATAPGGPHEEGFFYTWTAAELDRALAGLPTPHLLGLAAAGPGARAPLVVRRVPTTAADQATLAAERARLLAARAARPRPARDDKEVVAWNGLAIGALADGARVLDEPRYAERARRAALRVLAGRDRDGRLPRYRIGSRDGPPGVLDDYAALAGGLLDLYEATGEVRWFRDATALAGTMTRHFADPDGGFFFTADDQPATLVRRTLWQDGAEPAGNSLAALALLRLAAFTGDDAYRSRAVSSLGAPAAQLATAPDARATLLLGADWLLDGPREIVLVAPARRDELAPFRAALRSVLVPARVLVALTEAEARAAAGTVPLLDGKRAIDGRATAYVCRGFVCARPTHDPGELLRQLRAPARPADPAPRGAGR